MMLRIHFLLYKLRFLFFGTIGIVVSCLVLWLTVMAVGPANLQSKNTDTSVGMIAISMSDSPNVITQGLSTAMYELEETIDSVTQTIGNGARSAALIISQTGSQVAHAIHRSVVACLLGVGRYTLFLATSAGRSIAFVANVSVSGITFILRIPGTMFGLMSHASAVNALIKPNDHNQDVPIIDPRAPAVLAAKEALSVPQQTDQTTPQASTEAVWPIHGQVTTEFGEAGWAYQTVHTGIDISDGKAAGTTPIHAFRPGRVIGVERVGGLGNHVTIDHGSSVTSVYGHLASIAVTAGQEVGVDTVLGYEGSTGVSTGPHLHLEIRVDGKATDPRQFITGQP